MNSLPELAYNDPDKFDTYKPPTISSKSTSKLRKKLLQNLPSNIPAS